MNINMEILHSNIILSNKKTLKQELLAQSAYLKRLIDKHLRDYRRSLTPAEYVRMGNLEKSVSVSNIKCENNKYTVYVYFNENAVHRSGYVVWGIDAGKYDDDVQSFDSDESVNVALLINDGYEVKEPVWFREIKNFGIRKGNHFIDEAVKEFNRTNTLGIKLVGKYITNDRKW